MAPSLSRVIQSCETVQCRHTDYPGPHSSQSYEDKNILTFCFCHFCNYLLQSGDKLIAQLIKISRTKNNYYKRRILGLEKKSTKYMNSHKMIERIIGGIILINLLSTKSVSVVVKEDYRKVKDKINVDDCQFARLTVLIDFDQFLSF